jgi:TrmH family RNA methyltransferase
LLAEALAARLEIVAAAVTRRFLDAPAHAGLIAGLTQSAGEVFLAADSVMAAASPTRTPAGVVAIGRFSPAGAEAVFGGRGMVVCAVGVQDPGNVGAIIRVAEAAGITGVITTPGSASPLGWKALRASAGSALRLPLACGIDAAAACDRARTAGFRVVATCPADGADYDQIDFTRPTFLLVGGEGPGLEPALIAAADQHLRIPMQAPVESLNVAVATGILLYEARRQRRQPPPT